MKLFRVEVTSVLYVMAEDQYNAETMAELHVRDEEPVDTFVREVKAGALVEEEWKDGYPYGPRGSALMKTVEEIIAEMK